jgi:hypothetical protein
MAVIAERPRQSGSSIFGSMAVLWFVSDGVASRSAAGAQMNFHYLLILMGIVIDDVESVSCCQTVALSGPEASVFFDVRAEVVFSNQLCAMREVTTAPLVRMALASMAVGEVACCVALGQLASSADIGCISVVLI